jgi:hypothetical protein
VNVSDAILVGKGVERSNECCAVVCDNPLYGSPPTQDVFEYECG